MKIKIIKEAKVLFKSGETIDVSPDVAANVIRMGKAIAVVEKPKKKKED